MFGCFDFLEPLPESPVYEFLGNSHKHERGKKSVTEEIILGDAQDAYVGGGDVDQEASDALIGPFNDLLNGFPPRNATMTLHEEPKQASNHGNSAGLYADSSRPFPHASVSSHMSPEAMHSDQSVQHWVANNMLSHSNVAIPATSIAGEQMPDYLGQLVFTRCLDGQSLELAIDSLCPLEATTCEHAVNRQIGEFITMHIHSSLANCDGSTPDKQHQHIKRRHTSNMGKQGLKPQHKQMPIKTVHRPNRFPFLLPQIRYSRRWLH